MCKHMLFGFKQLAFDSVFVTISYTMLRKLFNLSEPAFPSLKNRDNFKTTVKQIQYMPNTQVFQLATAIIYQELIVKTNVLMFIPKLLISTTPLYWGKIRYML